MTSKESSFQPFSGLVPDGDYPVIYLGLSKKQVESLKGLAIVGSATLFCQIMLDPSAMEKVLRDENGNIDDAKLSKIAQDSISSLSPNLRERLLNDLGSTPRRRIRSI